MRFATPVMAVFMTAFLAAPALADAEASTPSISVSGTGTINAVPDMATINTGVVSQGETAREALDQNNEAMTALIATLQSAGLENRDIQTSDFSVRPNYAYSNRSDSDGYSQPPRIEGYEVSNTVSIRVRDLEELGGILDQVVTAGSNTINGISFSVENSEVLLEEARIRAVNDARAKAETLTGAAGVSLGDIRTISENSGSAPQPVMYRAMAMDAAPDVPIQGGELSFSVSVGITWDINQASAE